MNTPAVVTDSSICSMRNIYFRHINGITMVESMVVLAITGILTMIATPSFVGTTQRFRVLGETNLLLTSMTFARSEAIKRGIPVTMCASSDGTSCLGTATWQTGWIVFTDVGADRTVGMLLKVTPALKNSDSIAADNAVASVTFGHDGFTTGQNVGVVTFAIHTTPANSSATRCVAVSRTGRLETQSAGAGACA
ncbi:MAG: GspH/FimT family pseudopilin [Herminiimonas sp.]|nr:GspH/FimT family pseudopilin [Herminiimonas sp.]